MDLSIQEIVTAASGCLLAGRREECPRDFSIDTRTLKRGDFFVPLKGENTDGHQFIPAAFNGGAVGTFMASARKNNFTPPGRGAVVQVEDPLKALQDTAAYYRRRFSLPVVAVTGSAGKTTTKDFIASVLGGKFNLIKTEGNLNNEIGLPLMLLRLRHNHEAAVLEMGMSGFGEIAALTRMAGPSVGVITNIGEAHLEMVGSLEGVVKAKGELLDEMGSGGKAVLNGEDPRLLDMGKGFAGETIYYGFREGYPVRGENLRTLGGRTEFDLVLPGAMLGVTLPQWGSHTVLNALAAAAVGHLLGLAPAEIKEGLERAEVTSGRLQLEERAGMTVINDTYNANPTSVRASLKALADAAGKSPKGAVLGDMFELGEGAPSSHEEVGRFAAALGLDYLITLGGLSRNTARGARLAGMDRVKACLDREEALTALGDFASPGDFLLVKGSRGMQMERIVTAIGGDFSREDEKA